MKKIILLILLNGIILQIFAQDTLSRVSYYYDNGDPCKSTVRKELDRINRHYSVPSKKAPFCICDLTDTTNKLDEESDIYFINGHVYYVFVADLYCKVSIIMILENNNAYFFEGLNCLKPKHNIKDVLFWMGHNMSREISSSEMQRIIHYDSYYHGAGIDSKTVSCEWCKPSKNIVHKGSWHKYKKPKKRLLKPFDNSYHYNIHHIKAK